MRRSDWFATAGLFTLALVAAAWGAAMRPAGMPDHHRGLDATVVIRHAGGDLRMSAPTGTMIRYTLDGSIPTSGSSVYTDPIPCRADHRRLQRWITTPTSVQWRHPKGDLIEAVVVSARACDEEGRCGPATTRTFFPEGTGTGLRVVSLVLPAGALLDPDSGIYVIGHGIFRDEEQAVRRFPHDQRWWKYPGNFQFKGKEWERRGDLELFEPDGRSGYETRVAVRINGNNTRGFPQHALRVTFDTPMRDVHGATHKSMVLRASGNDQDRAFMRDAVQHRLCAQLPFATSAAEPVVLFINGAYWGIHDLRERLDDDELARRYGLKKGDFTVLEDRALLDHGDDAEVGRFWKLVQMAESADPASPHYADDLAAHVDMDGFLTYMAAQIILANTDWPDQNVKYWRYTGRDPDPIGPKDGRWRFAMGDSDMGLGYHVTADVDLFAHLAARRGPVARLFNAAMRNMTCRARFRAIMGSLLEGPLSTVRLVEEVEAWRGLIAADMPAHIRRWRRPLSSEAWGRHVDELLTFAHQRGEEVGRQLDHHLPVTH